MILIIGVLFLIAFALTVAGAVDCFKGYAYEISKTLNRGRICFLCGTLFWILLGSVDADFVGFVMLPVLFSIGCLIAFR